MRGSKLRRAAVATTAGVLAVTLSLPATAQDDQGGTLSIGFESDIQYFDPALGYDVVSWPAERMMFETLVTYDEGTTLVPALATEMPTISEDGLTYTFTLRPDIPFVRQGEVVRTMTADDVVFSLNRLLRPDVTPNPSPVGPAFFAVIDGADQVLAGTAETASGLKAVDELTVEITLSKADRTFLNALAMPFGSVVPAEIAGLDASAFGADPVGTGPYFLESYTPGESAIFQRNPHYWAEGMPKADTIEFRLLLPAETQLLQAMDNQLDIMGDQIPAADWPTVSTDPAVMDRIVASDLVAITYLSMDTSSPDTPLANPLVRQAINHAIDKDNQIRIVNGRATAAFCIFPTGMPGFDETCKPYEYDVDMAKALMEEAAVSGFSTQLYTDTTEISRLSAEAIVADLAQIGIEVELITQDFDTLLGTIQTPHAAPLVYIGWFQDFPDPSDFIDPILSCASAVEGGANIAWYCNEEIDARAAEARGIASLDEAIPVYQEIQADIMADAPWVPLIFPRWTLVRSERIPSFTALHPVWYWDLAAIPVVE
jgi:peptide/nickel transport system substrate-binding protein/oligopeptide transport system substrate-binding protein